MTVESDLVDEVLPSTGSCPRTKPASSPRWWMLQPSGRMRPCVHSTRTRSPAPSHLCRGWPGRARCLLGSLAACRAMCPRRTGRITAWRRNDAFVVLADDGEAEFVVGMVGKFMTPTQLEFRRIEPGEFATFSEPGYGKVALNFRVRPYGRSRSLFEHGDPVTTDPRLGRPLPAVLAGRRSLCWPDHAPVAAAGQAQRGDRRGQSVAGMM